MSTYDDEDRDKVLAIAPSIFSLTHFPTDSREKFNDVQALLSFVTQFLMIIVP